MKKAKRMGWVVWPVILFPMLIPSVVYADWGDILSRVQVYGGVQETYDNNVNLTRANQKNDYITTVSLGFRFSTLPRSETTGEFQQPSISEETKYGVSLDFLPAYVFYAKHTSDNYLSLSGSLDSWYTWDKKLTFRLKDYLIRSEEPLEQNYTASALPDQILLGNQTGRAIYIRNVVQPSLEYRFGREDIISINYLNNVYRNHDDIRFEDSTENYINPKLTYWFDIRNGVSLEYALDLGNFQRSANMTGNMGRSRYTYRFNPTMSVFGEFTFQGREFSPSPPPPNPLTTPSTITNYNIYQPTIGFEYAFSPTLSLVAQFGYFWEIPKIGSSETGPAYNVLITQRAQRTTYTLGFQGGYTEDYYTAQNLGFAKYNQVIGTITHQLMERLALTFAARYQRPKYPDGRLDNIWGVTTGASYGLLRWLALALDFSYSGDRSNREEDNYTDFRGTFKITATY